jgi:ABC-type lipoprotein release transport system permease subunit
VPDDDRTVGRHAIGTARQSVKTLSKWIEHAIPGVASVTARDYIHGDVQIRLVKSMAWATTLIALFLRSLAILNTIILAVGGLIGVTLSGIGGLYPALRGASLNPTETLHHE